MKDARKICSFLIVILMLILSLSASFAGAAIGEVVELTLDEAKKLAVSNSFSVMNQEKIIDQLEILRAEALIRNDSLRFAPDNWIVDQQAKQALLNLVQTDIDLNMARKMEVIEKAQIEHMVELMVLSIMEKENDIRIEENRAALQEAQLVIDRLRKNVGVISQMELDMSTETYNQALNEVETLRLSLAQAHLSLENLLGTKNVRVTVQEDDFATVPVATMDLVTHIRRTRSSDPYMWLQEQRIEKARMDMTLFTFSDFMPATPYRVRVRSYEIEQNQLRALRQRYDESMNGKYHDLQQLENQITMLSNQLELMNRQLRIAEVQYEVGVITKISLRQKSFERDTLMNQLSKMENQLYRMNVIFRKPYLMPDYLS